MRKSTVSFGPWFRGEKRGGKVGFVGPHATAPPFATCRRERGGIGSALLSRQQSTGIMATARTPHTVQQQPGTTAVSSADVRRHERAPAHAVVCGGRPMRSGRAGRQAPGPCLPSRDRPYRWIDRRGGRRRGWRSSMLRPREWSGSRSAGERAADYPSRRRARVRSPCKPASRSWRVERSAALRRAAPWPTRMLAGNPCSRSAAGAAAGGA